ncbi:MAG: tyrosine-type recombinase/integrase [Pseudomonadota bacterium]|nr:tyrosine-type recombinase/integrase [Pseudomonadota bacterium]
MKRDQIKKRPMSDTTLATLEPEAKEYREPDGKCLYFRVKPDGNKSWQLRYKKPNGTWSFLGLGTYPEVSGQLARQKAAELLADSSTGADLVITKQQRKQAELDNNNATFERLIYEFLDNKVTKWTDGTMTRNKGALEKHILPIMGKRKYTEIKPIEWMNLFQSIQREKGIIEQSNRMRALCQEAYDLAKVTGRIEYNPIEGLHRFLETHKSENMRHVSPTELPALLRAIRNYPTREVAIGLELLSLVFCRPSELRNATWAEIDLDAALWTIPVQRMKKRREMVIPLSRQVLELLAELRQLNGDSPYLFPSRSSRNKPKSDAVFIMALRRLGYEGRQSPHGFRHIASTTLREKGFMRDHVEAALAHKVGGVEGVYNKADYLADRIPMMQWWADYLEGLRTESNVIPFSKSANA